MGLGFDVGTATLIRGADISVKWLSPGSKRFELI